MELKNWNPYYVSSSINKKRHKSKEFTPKKMQFSQNLINTLPNDNHENAKRLFINTAILMSLASSASSIATNTAKASTTDNATSEQKAVTTDKNNVDASKLNQDPGVDPGNWTVNTPLQIEYQMESQHINPKDIQENSTYKIQYGDTYWNIAIATGSSVDELVNLNNVNDPNIIKTGDMIKLPTAHSIDPTDPTN